MARTLYQYTQLHHRDEIRLLELRPGRDSEIHCKISVHRIDSLPSYEALSYTWGEEGNPQVVFCHDGTNPGNRLAITRNCFAALKALRCADRPRLLWIDAIAINQADVQEVNTQVSIMSRIYKGASRVLIHLGDDADASQLVMEIAKTREWWGQNEPRSRPGQPVKFEPWERAIIRAFISRPWFTRVWILQEVFMATEALILCGDQVVDWRRFIGVLFLDGWEIIGAGNFQFIPYVMYIDPSRTPRFPLLELLERTRFSSSQDPRDKVFAVIGMSESASVLSLLPDYRKSVAEVYTSIAVFLLRQNGLAFLSCVQYSARLPGIPSWVPDWSQYPHHHSSKVSESNRAGGSPEQYLAEQYMDHRISRTLCLKIRGLKFDTISKLGKVAKIRDWYWRDTIEEWIEAAVALQPGEGSSNPKESLQALICPTIGRSPQASQGLLDMALDRYQKYPTNSSKAQTRLHVQGRRFMVTEKTYIGLAPEDARVGDVVVVFLGGHVPFVIRESNESGAFELIGECLVDGLSQGQAMNQVDLSHASDDVPQPPLVDFTLV